MPRKRNTPAQRFDVLARIELGPDNTLHVGDVILRAALLAAGQEDDNIADLIACGALAPAEE